MCDKIKKIMKEKIENFFKSRYPSLKKKDLSKIAILEFLDSVNIYDFIHYIEKNFRINIKNEDVLFKNFSSISKIEKLIQKYIKK